MNDRTDETVAEAFPVGEYLRDEIDARDWSVGEFARIIGRPVQAVSEILNGKKALTAETAAEIATATGTEASTWLNLQNRFALWLQATAQAEKLAAIKRRSQLAALVPLTELRKRGLITAGDIGFEEKQVWEALGITSSTQTPAFVLAARRSAGAAALSPAQTAWLAFARAKASEVPAQDFDQSGLSEIGNNLTRTVTSLASLSEIPHTFARVGVRLVYLAPFKSGKLDGACFTDDHGPVIALSGQGNAMDKLLFTLLHETAHVVLGHAHGGVTLDDDVAAGPMNEQERAADALASSWALRYPVPSGPRISRQDVVSCAATEGVHPAVIVGRLHFDKTVPWAHLNGLVPKVNESLVRW